MTTPRLCKLPIIAAVTGVVLATGGVARAQSPLDGFNPGTNSGVRAVAVQPDGKIVVGGEFTTLGGGGLGTTPRNRIGRLNADGSLDTTFDPGTDATVTALAIQPDGKILVVGDFTLLGGGGTGTTVRQHIGRLNPNGSLDTSFNPGADADVDAVAVQADGKIVVGGEFTMLGGGGGGTTPRTHIGRLNADGSLDLSFDSAVSGFVNVLAVQANGQVLVGACGSGILRLNIDGSLDRTFDPGVNSCVVTVAVEPDGQILVGGVFTMLGGGGDGTATRNHIGRLNANGTLDTSFDPGADEQVRTLAVQPDGKILVGGVFTTLGGGGTGTTIRNNLGRLNPDGSLDTTFAPGANGTVQSLAVQLDGKIVVGGNFGALGGGGTGTTQRNGIGRLYSDGSLDADLNPGANGVVSALAVQPDGRVLVGGDFTTLGGGGTGTPSRNRIGRLHADGSLDSSFNPGANDIVRAVAVQTDGKILVGGDFTTLGGGGTGTTPRSRLARLNADGAVDSMFDPGANGAVVALAVQPDGKILVAGNFTALGGGGSGISTRNRIGRLNVDGSLDASFDPGANGSVTTLAVQADGKILVGGSFTALGGGGTGTTPRNSIGRLNADGSPDTSFDPGANGSVTTLAIQADGKILVGGDFTALGGGGTGATPRNSIGRLNPDGSPDTSFDPGANGSVATLQVQTDGTILVGGNFTTLGSGGTGLTTRNFIGRLNGNGSLDPAFDPGANLAVNALAVQPDGKVVVGGSFTALGGGNGTTARNFIGRLTNTAVAIQDLRVASGGSVVTWSRSGTGPDLSRVTFESSTDDVSYTALGVGTRVPGGWQLTGQSLPTNQDLFIRARGDYQTALCNGSGSIIESIRNAYVSCPVIAPISLAAGTAGLPYASTFTASGAIGVISFGLAGTLPSGITFTAAGLSGTPTQAGSFPLTLTATDESSGCAAAQNVTLTINCQAITLSAVFPNGTAGVPYPTTTVIGTGPTGTATFAVTSGTLPSGLTLSSAGAVTGTPTAAGTFTFTVTATTANGCSGSRGFTLTVSVPVTMSLDKTAFHFAATSTGAAFTQQTQSQTVRLTQTGSGTVTWMATAIPSWLTVTPPSGSGSATLTLSVQFVAGLPTPGTTQAAFTISLNGSTNTLSPIDVTLTTVLDGASAVPFGVIDTPLNGVTGVTGSIGVTGWALDDVETRQVQVWRDPVAGEGASQIFIGNAVFVDGSRPDVAVLFPTAPRRTRAGWGYLLLTNFLPNQGNGTFTLHAYADDAEGNRTLLGSRTITCANSTATVPFGAIDTPGQGETISGTNYANFGWVLVRGPALAYPPFGTVSVVVDGVFGAAPVGWTSRQDLTALFPAATYPGVTNALGVAPLDTTALANGAHTIAWVVTADNGRADGIGSRFFTVSNGTAGLVEAPGAAMSAQLEAGTGPDRSVTLDAPAVAAPLSRHEVEALPLDDAMIVGRSGYDIDGPVRSLDVVNGRATIQAEELGRIELQLDAASTEPYPGMRDRFSGYLQLGDDLGPLPIGSTLDAATGTFTWLAGVGFVHAYDLVFVRWRDGRAIARQDVRIVLHPKGGSRVGPQVMIDTPVAGGVRLEGLSLPLTLAGWALDPDAWMGTGVSTVHVWAYPLGGGDPQFVGVASYGGARPDVAAIFGDRFTSSGYGLTVDALPPGTYDLAVFACSTALGRFVSAKTVRVRVRP